MTINVRCPSCGKINRASPEHVGKRAKCKCGHIFQIPPTTTLTDDVHAVTVQSDNQPIADESPPPIEIKVEQQNGPPRKGFWASMKDAVNDANAAATKVARDYPVVYAAGPYDLKPKSQGTLTLDNESMVFKSAILRRELFRIPYASILAADVDTAERMTVARVVALGIFAFGFKKKDKFLNLKFRDETNLEVSVVFGKAAMGPQMEALAGKIMTKRRESMAQSIPSTPGSTDERTSIGTNVGDITSQLEKLAELHGKQLISDDEYEQKRQEILARL